MGDEHGRTERAARAGAAHIAVDVERADHESDRPGPRPVRARRWQ